MIVLKFSDIDEYKLQLQDDLDRAHPPILAQIVRCTVRRSYGGPGGMFYRYEFVSQYIRTDAEHGLAMLVELTTFIGQTHPSDAEDANPIRERSDDLRSEIVKLIDGCQTANIAVLPGFYEVRG